MAKYIDADELIAEIEFAKSVYSNPKRVVHGVADAFRQDGRAAMCDDILKKNNSLQQEQPEVDLEKEIAGMYQALFGTDVINRKERLYLDTFEALARHFAKWGAEHLRDSKCGQSFYAAESYYNTEWEENK